MSNPTEYKDFEVTPERMQELEERRQNAELTAITVLATLLESRMFSGLPPAEVCYVLAYMSAWAARRSMPLSVESFGDWSKAIYEGLPKDPFP